MDYKKTKKENMTIHIINTNRFKSINVVLFLTKQFTPSSIPYGNMLVSNLVYSSKKYNTKNKMAIKAEELYGTKISSSYGLTGKCEQFIFTLDFLNPKYTEEKYLDESLEFLKEILFNPNVENNSFKEEYFNIIKKSAEANINSIKDNPNMYSGIKYSSLMYKGTPSAYSTIPTIKQLQKVTPQNLYEFYKKLFNGEYKVDIAIIGEVSDTISDIIYDKFKNIKSLDKKLSFKIIHNYKDSQQTKIESLAFNQSKLYMGYRLVDMDFHELNHVLRVYNTILGTMNDSILFNIVREKHSLCYSIGSYVSRYNPSLTIYAGINKNNYEKTLQTIKECVSLMSDRKTLERLFDSAKKTINTYLNNYYDDIIMQVNGKYNSEFETVEDVETTRENINKVTIEEVINLNKKIKLSTIYLLKGDNN